jgi:hypothetical protein
VAILTLKNKIIVDQNLYKWHRHWGRLQKKFFAEAHELYEKRKIDNFINSKGFQKVYHIKDNYLDFQFQTTQNIDEADLILITDQKFSRYRCEKIISDIKQFLEKCPDLFVCLNRHYLNITGTETDETLPDDYQDAIETWLQKSMPFSVENHSERFIDDGSYFTWVIPDQKFYITKK